METILASARSGQVVDLCGHGDYAEAAGPLGCELRLVAGHLRPVVSAKLQRGRASVAGQGAPDGGSWTSGTRRTPGLLGPYVECYSAWLIRRGPRR